MNQMRPSSKSGSDYRGFTLIELLAVIAIVGILAALLLISLQRVRQATQSTICASNLREIGVGAQLWAADNKGRMPGGGLLSATGYSGSWQDVFNYVVFPAYKSSGSVGLQRLGDTPKDGMMYCPSMERWSTNTTLQSSVRAYAINAHIQAPAGSVDIGSIGPFSLYKPGAVYNSFSSPARVFYVFESEIFSDVLRVNTVANLPPPAGKIVWDNPSGDTGNDMSPYSANNRYYSFRHNLRMNILFLDGHVTSLSPEQMGPLNAVSSFHD